MLVMWAAGEAHRHRKSRLTKYNERTTWEDQGAGCVREKQVVGGNCVGAKLLKKC